MRPIAAIGRIGASVGKTLFKTRLSIAQPARARPAMTMMLRLAISGTRFGAEPRVVLLINYLQQHAVAQRDRNSSKAQPVHSVDPSYYELVTGFSDAYLQRRGTAVLNPSARLHGGRSWHPQIIGGQR